MDVAIVGAGAAGLSAAYDLTRTGHRVVIYEAAGEVGGLAAGFKAPHWDWTLEKYYHHWFASDHSILGLIDELGWRDRVLFPRPVTVIYYRGRFHPFDSMFTNMPLFMLRHFPIWDVARFGAVGAYLRFWPDWRPLEAETADAWTRRWFGARVYETIWRPMLVGKFGDEHVATGKWIVPIGEAQKRGYVDSLSLRMGNISYLKNAELDMKADIGMDMTAKKYSFKQNKIKLNQLALAFDGWVQSAGQNIDLDLSFKTPSTDFKSLLSMIPRAGLPAASR